jgi:uncharacterized membrane protein
MTGRTNQAPMNRIPMSKIFWATMALLSAGVALVSYRYLPKIAVLAPTLAPQIVANLFARPWLDVHIAGAATALLIGPFQFLPGLRARHRALHRWMGRLYVFSCLGGGVAGLIVAFGSTAGPIATAGFGSLAVIWIYANIQAWRLAMARRFDEHRAWMIRSFALTFAAVTLRLYLPLIPLTGYSFVEGYRAISFLAWVPNLMVAEIYVRATSTCRVRAQTA